MFRIDRRLVSFLDNEESAKRVYTSIGELPQKEQREAEARKRKELEAEILQLKERAKQEAEKIVAQAREQANEQAGALLKKAEAEADALLKKARQEGYEEGARKAEQELRELRRRETDRIRGVLEQIGRRREAVINSLEDEIISLVMDISKKVINVQLEKDDKTFVEIVRNALVKLNREGKIELRVSSEVYRRLFAEGLADFVINHETVQVAVTEEPGFNRGDCIVESECETIDAGVDSQLKKIELALRSVAGGSE